MQTGVRFKNLQPLIPALEDVDKTIAFYRDSLGFQPAWIDATPATFAILSRGEVAVMLVKSNNKDVPSLTSLRIGVENIEALFAEYSEKKLIRANGNLTVKPWGLKEFAILDINGVCITFHEAPKAENKQLGEPNRELTTQRLRLVPLQKTHAEIVYPIYSNPSVMRLWHTPPHKSLKETDRLLSQLTSTSSWWLIQFKESGETAGVIGCHGIIESKPTGMGYILAEKFQRRGLGQEAAKAVLEHLFTQWNIPVVELWIYQDNDSSIRLAERLGFTLERSFERSGPDGTSRKMANVHLLKQSEWWKSRTGSRQSN